MPSHRPGARINIFLQCPYSRLKTSSEPCSLKSSELTALEDCTTANRCFRATARLRGSSQPSASRRKIELGIGLKLALPLLRIFWNRRSAIPVEPFPHRGKLLPYGARRLYRGVGTVLDVQAFASRCSIVSISRNHASRRSSYFPRC